MKTRIMQSLRKQRNKSRELCKGFRFRKTKMLKHLKPITQNAHKLHDACFSVINTDNPCQGYYSLRITDYHIWFYMFCSNALHISKCIILFWMWLWATLPNLRYSYCIFYFLLNYIYLAAAVTNKLKWKEHILYTYIKIKWKKSISDTFDIWERWYFINFRFKIKVFTQTHIA